MEARNRADLRTAWWARERANRQNTMGADQPGLHKRLHKRAPTGRLCRRAGHMWCVQQKQKKKHGAKDEGALVQ